MISLKNKGQIDSWADLLLLIAGGITIIFVAAYSFNGSSNSETQLYRNEVYGMHIRDKMIFLMEAVYESDAGNLTLPEMIDLWYSHYDTAKNEARNPYFNLFTPVRKALDEMQEDGVYKLYIYEKPDYGYVIPGAGSYSFIKSIVPTRSKQHQIGGNLYVMKTPTGRGDLYIKITYSKLKR